MGSKIESAKLDTTDHNGLDQGSAGPADRRTGPGSNLFGIPSDSLYGSSGHAIKIPTNAT